MPKQLSKKRLTYPEPGRWVLDTAHGMPEIVPPGPLPSRKLSKQELQEYVSYEGLGFCIFEFIPTKSVADAHLAKLWRKARAAMADIIDCLGEAPEVEVLTGGEDITDDEFEI